MALVQTDQWGDAKLTGDGKRAVGTTVGIIVALLLLFPILSLFGLRTVDAGEVAVVTKFGQVTGRILDPGAHFIAPFIEGTQTYNTKKVIYETASQDGQKNSKADYKDFPVDTNTEDGQQVDVYYTIRFSVDPTKANWIAQNVGSQEAAVEKIVKTESRIWARNIPRRYSADYLYTGNGSSEVQNEIFASLNKTFSDNGLVLDSVGVREIKFSDNYVGAIEGKQIEAVKVETEKNKAEQAKYQKEASITQAEAQAQAQKLQRETISTELLQKLWIERWNGVLPTYVMGSEASNLIQLPTK